ncbi:MAG: YdiU family protein [Pseudomonadota bacterium]
MDEMTLPQIPFDNSYARLPERFFTRLDPTPVAAPSLIAVNEALAEELGIDAAALTSPGGVEALAGNRRLSGAEPLAQVYAGHQFGGWSAQLGDGRAILLGEVIDGEGRRRDIQLKGSGQTPYSRMGDGRAPLGPVLREYIVSEAMAALGVPTTRALCAVATGEPVYREEGPLPGGVLTRVAASHIRVGTFQYFGARNDREGLETLLDHVIERHYPQAAETDNPALALLAEVIEAQAKLIAQWMGFGFIHGVMNTDNMTISGETIDFGPCAFMDAFDPKTVFSSIDQMGRYAYEMQPGIGHWNLARLAVALLPLIGEGDEAVEHAKTALDAFPAAFDAAWIEVGGRKLGLSKPVQTDKDLMNGLFSLMAAKQADFTGTFRALAAAVDGDEGPLRSHVNGDGVDEWLVAWRERLTLETDPAATIRASNPVYIPRNHIVEDVISSGVAGDFAPFRALDEVLSNPYQERVGLELYAQPAPDGSGVHRTFCGT